MGEEKAPTQEKRNLSSSCFTYRCHKPSGTNSLAYPNIIGECYHWVNLRGCTEPSLAAYLINTCSKKNMVSDFYHFSFICLY